MELRLPSEYQEVEYIENTGTQYIITDLLFPKELESPKIEWGFMQIAVPSGDNMIFGYWSNGSIYYEVYNSTTLSYASIGKNHYDRISNSNLTKDMFIAGVMTKEAMYLNGYSYATNAEDTIDQSVRPMAIFAWNSSSGRTYTNKGARIYYLRFYDGNTKMADYVPCYRKSDGEIGMYDTITKTFYTNSGTDTFLKGADVTRYIDNVSVLDTRRKILLNTPHIDASVGDLVTFNTDLSAPLKSCKVSFLPVQEGEGDPSPDNVKEIKGWNGIETYKSGKNLVIESSIINNCYIRSAVTATGTEIGSMQVLNGYKCTDYIKVFPNTVYTISFKWNNAAAAGLAFYSDAKVENVISGVPFANMQKSPYTFTTPQNCNYIRFTSKGLDSFMGLTQGEIALTEEIYDSSVISISWTDSVGTVYSGYVDLASGELVMDKAIKTFDGSETWDTATVSGKTAYQTRRPADIASGAVFTSNIITRITSLSGTVPDNVGYFEGTYLNIYAPSLSLEEWIAMLTATPLQIVYKLRDPIHYQLTPQQILTLKGINNVYSDTNGQTEIKYWKH